MIIVWKTPIIATVGQILNDLRLNQVVVESRLLRHLRDAGSDFMVTCPFHANGMESKPSMGIMKYEKRKQERTYEAGTAHCYSCGYKADLPTFISDLLGLGNALEGFKWLNGRYNFGAGDTRVDLNLDLDRHRVVADRKLDADEVLKYHKNLKRNERAKEYLERRKIKPQVIEQFLLGYNPEYDSITVPVQDRTGIFRMIKERSIEGKTFHNTAGADKSAVVYGLYEAVKARTTKKIWIVESEIDALTLWGWGEVAVALMGSHISPTQIKELTRTPYRTFILGLDNDKAGREGIKQLKKELIPLGFRLFNVKWTVEKKDINECEETEFNLLQTY